ncbi:hypothetical protein [Dongia sp.]|uniref:hypothetical protein n=1 Tax=Dongia sp. TaxID=1977262 RepID=UPI0035AF56B5
MVAKPESGDVPTQVFESFIKKLEADGESKELIERLRKAIVVNRTLSDRELLKAIFPGEEAS